MTLIFKSIALNKKGNFGTRNLSLAMEINKIRTKIIKDSFVRYFKRFEMVNTSFLLFSKSNILQGTL